MIHNVKEMILLRNDTFMDGLYYPVGFDLGMHTGFAWVDTLVSIPLAALMWLYWLLQSSCISNMCPFLLFVDLAYSEVWAYPCSTVLHSVLLGYFHAFTFFEINLGRPTGYMVAFVLVAGIGFEATA